MDNVHLLWYPDGTDNPWQTWYEAQDVRVRARHDYVVRVLSSNRWGEPYSAVLRDTDGIIEIKIKSNVQHRLLGF
jgi:hypothetical protein